MSGLEISRPEVARDPKTGQLLPGVQLNPAGRPKGSRNKLGEAFIEALHDDFQKNGVTAIERVRATEPAQYLKVIAAIVPKELNIKHDAFDGVSDEQIAALIVAARSALGLAEGGGEEVRATAH